MKVVALRRGLFGGAVYEPGDEFDVPEEVMTAKKDADGHAVVPRWFEPVKEPVAESAGRASRSSRRAEE